MSMSFKIFFARKLICFYLLAFVRKLQISESNTVLFGNFIQKTQAWQKMVVTPRNLLVWSGNLSFLKIKKYTYGHKPNTLILHTLQYKSL